MIKICLSIFLSIAHIQAEFLQYNIQRTSDSILKNSLQEWKKSCIKWYLKQDFYQNLGTAKYGLKHHKEWYRENLCGKVNTDDMNTIIDQILTGNPSALDAFFSDKSQFITQFHRNQNNYRNRMDGLLANEEKFRHKGLILYQGMYTRASNLYEFINNIRHTLQLKRNASRCDRLVKIFYKSPRHSKNIFWNEWTNDGIDQIANRFLDHVKKDAENNKYSYDMYPVNLSLLSFASSLISSEIGESPLYFLMTDNVTIGQEKNGLFLIELIIKDVLEELIPSEEKELQEQLLRDLFHNIPISIRSVDNRRILQIIFPEQEINTWRKLGWWSVSHGGISYRDKIQDLGDLYLQIKHFDKNASFEDNRVFLNIDHNMQHDQNDSSDLSSDQSISFNDSERTITENENDHLIPVFHRLQARIVFNMWQTLDYMENLPILKDQNFSLDPAKDQNQLKKSMLIVARRFSCWIAGYAEFNGERWIPQRHVQKQRWEKMQSIFPYFKDQYVDVKQCSEKGLN